MASVVIPPYTGWRPRSMRMGRGSSGGGGDANRSTKRARLGNRSDRNFYKWCKAPSRDPDRYARLCSISDGLNGVRR